MWVKVGHYFAEQILDVVLCRVLQSKVNKGIDTKLHVYDWAE